MNRIQRRSPLSRTDFYGDMYGPGGHEDGYNSRWIGLVQTVTIVAW